MTITTTSCYSAGVCIGRWVNMVVGVSFVASSATCLLSANLRTREEDHLDALVSTVLTKLTTYGQADDEKITGSTDLLAEFSSIDRCWGSSVHPPLLLNS